jgi:tRNA wybutosine-synthesizing protein 4
MASIERIQWTAGESSLCKFHAVEKEYYEDEYAKAMHSQVAAKIALHTNRKSPLINRGYYARVISTRRALEAFLYYTVGNERQLIFLGVGYDTAPLNAYEVSGEGTRIFEVDFPEIMTKKSEIYKFNTSFAQFFAAHSSSFSMPSEDKHIQHIGHFSLLGIDLRNTDKLIQMLLQAGLDPTKPTILFSECVLVYIDHTSSEKLTAALGSLLQGATMWVTYDMVTPSDRYGAMMVYNLTSAGFHIPGIVDYPTLAAQSQRFTGNGWDTAESCTMKQFYLRAISDEEKARLKALEMLDEIEEWNMLMDHYSLTIAAKGTEALQLIAPQVFHPDRQK